MMDQVFNGCSMGDLIVTAVQRGGDRDAFVLGDQRVTYRAMGQKLSQIMQVLDSLGLQRGDTLATLSSNRPEAYFISAVAYLLGLRVLWMNPMSSHADHCFQVEDAGVKLMLVDPDYFGERALQIAQSLKQPPRLMGLDAWGTTISCPHA